MPPPERDDPSSPVGPSPFLARIPHLQIPPFGAGELEFPEVCEYEIKGSRDGCGDSSDNTAYRQMRDLLSNFLIEVARDHFRKSSGNADDYWRVKNELQHQHELLKQREKRSRSRKKKFAEQLGEFFGQLETDQPATIARKIYEGLEQRIGAIEALSISDPDDASKALISLESEVKSELRELRSQYTINRPRGLGLTKVQTDDWNAYLVESEKLESEQFTPLEEQIRTSVSEAVSEISEAFDKRRRIDLALEEIRTRTERQIQKVKKETSSQQTELNECVVGEIREHIATFHSTLKDTLSEFQRTDVSEFTSKELDELQSRLEKQLGNVGERETKALEGLRDQLLMLSDAIRYDESIADVTVALEEKAENFRAQVDQYANMAQIGTAVGIIQHEFSSTISMMRDQIRQLRGWAATNPKLGEIYKQIRMNFEHLDEYMNVFKPFDRRLQRKKIPIPGQEIRYYLMRLFEDRLERHNIKLKGSRSFDSSSIEAYPSTIYPCFVNLVDNSIYWLTREVDGRPSLEKRPKEIYLDANEEGFSVGNNGPGIEKRIADRVFDFGYSKKRDGQGMGLYVSREILRRDGMDLTLLEPGNSKKVFFQIVNSEIELRK